MGDDQEDELAQFVAERLAERADQIVEHWIRWVRTRVENPTVDALPRRALLDHVPPVVRLLTEYVKTPTFAAREELIGHLRIHGQIRRDQGYEATDIMAEFDGLSHMIYAAMQQEVEAEDDRFPASAAMKVFGRLSDGLRAMSYVTLTVYQQTANQRQQDLAIRLGEFGHAIAHELKNPLDAIKMSVDLLETLPDAELPESAEQHVDLIKRALKHAAQLIDDIEVLSMTQGAESRSRMMPLPQLFEDVQRQLHNQANDGDVAIEIVGSVPRVAVESMVGTLALLNVVLNGIKYSDPDKDERWVRIEAEIIESEDTPVVEVRVTDNGLGIPADLQARVFQRGFRAHPEHADGTGLGLSIVQELLMERGGRIYLDSSEAEGTTVTLQMRAIDAEPSYQGFDSNPPATIMGRSAEMTLSPTPPPKD